MLLDLLPLEQTTPPVPPTAVQFGDGRPLITYTPVPVPDRRVDDELALALLGAF